MRKILALSLLPLLSACMSTRVQLHPAWDPKQKPAYEDYFDYYALGFAGSPSLNLKKVCMDQKVYGLRRLQSPEDVAITVATLGIYSPATVQVWCGE